MKAELTQDKLFTVIVSNIRSYDKSLEVELLKRNLEHKVEERTHQLKARTDELIESNATKDKFFSIIAHDLKNPLGNMKAISDLLSENYANYPEVDKIDLILDLKHSADNIFSLLENLLQWSRSQTGRIPFEPEKLKFSYILQSCFELYYQAALEKEIELINYTDGEFEVFADPNMLSTVLRNLVSNAIKFTSKGGRVTVSATNTPDHSEILVSDTGVGILSNDIDKLFRIDVHHSTVGTLQEKGTGLGLIICRDFIEKHGGKISVVSNPDSGSVFKIILPLNKD
jgi:signal transduction histidine kinase